MLNKNLCAGKQLMICNTGCTIRGYFEIISQTFGSFNLSSCSTSTSTSANEVRSDFAEAVADTPPATVECKSSNMHQSQILILQILLLHFLSSQVQHQHLLFHMMCFECARKLTEKCSLVAPGCSRILDQKKIK